MYNFYEMLQKINSNSQSKINKFCEPLTRYFGVNHFWFQKLTNDGHYSVLGNQLQWMEYFFEEKLYSAIPHFRHPSLLPSGISLIRRIDDCAVKKMTNAATNKFNIHFSLMLMNKNSEGIEGFGFAINSDNELQHELLLNNINLLHLFIKQFREQNHSIFELIRDNKSDMAAALGSIFYDMPNKIVAPTISPHSFLKEIGLGHLAVVFSSIEIKVIKYLLQGFSAPQIASLLFLSKRTIEHHIERIKDRLHSDSKSNLIQKLRTLESIGYFIPFF